MDTSTKKSMHPLTAMAAVSLTLFSLVGIGAITGLIPTSLSQSAQVQPLAAERAKPAVTDETAAATARKTAALIEPPLVKHKPAAKPAKPVAQAARPVQKPTPIAMADAPAVLAPPPAPMLEPAKPLCHDCGQIESVRELEKKGAATGTGVAIGGIAGGLLGRQTGNGRGRDAMTVLGAIGGAIAGNEIEKRTKTVKSYQIDIRFDDGTTRLITQDTPPAWRAGDRIKLVNGLIVANNN